VGMRALAVHQPADRLIKGAWSAQRHVRNVKRWTVRAARPLDRRITA
jgi:hypothetical protein